MSQTLRTFSGSLVALATPFSPDGQVDYKQLEALVEFQLEPHPLPGGERQNRPDRHRQSGRTHSGDRGRRFQRHPPCRRSGPPL